MSKTLFDLCNHSKDYISNIEYSKPYINEYRNNKIYITDYSNQFPDILYTYYPMDGYGEYNIKVKKENGKRVRTFYQNKLSFHRLRTINKNKKLSQIWRLKHVYNSK